MRERTTEGTQPGKGRKAMTERTTKGTKHTKGMVESSSTITCRGRRVRIETASRFKVVLGLLRFPCVPWFTLRGWPPGLPDLCHSWFQLPSWPRNWGPGLESDPGGGAMLYSVDLVPKAGFAGGAWLTSPGRKVGTAGGGLTLVSIRKGGRV